MRVPIQTLASILVISLRRPVVDQLKPIVPGDAAVGRTDYGDLCEELEWIGVCDCFGVYLADVLTQLPQNSHLRAHCPMLLFCNAEGREVCGVGYGQVLRQAHEA